MRLKRIDIELQTWGDHKGKYAGKITFEDGTTDSFTFGLTPEMCARYLNPIAQEIINSSKELGDKLAQSFTRELNP
jgi:hypothetical protein